MASVIVVEGVHDVARLKAIYPDCNCVITNGREIDNSTIELIKELSKNHEIIIFTDPDSPGERIRNIITDAVPNAKQAFLRKKDCISNNRKKVGIEHASAEAIINALDNVYTPTFKEDVITMNELFELGLNGNSNSSILRDKISEYLNIGKPNCKTFLKRLNLLQIDKEELKEIICKVK
jgi:ribonuclease M5